MVKGCYPYSVSDPVYSHDSFIKGEKTSVYHQTSVALYEACIDQTIPDPNNPNGFVTDFHYAVDPKTKEKTTKAITYQDCINKILDNHPDIPTNKNDIKKIKIDYIYPGYKVKGNQSNLFLERCIDPLDIEKARGFDSCVQEVLQIFSSYLNIEFIPAHHEITNTTPKTIRIGLASGFPRDVNGQCFYHAAKADGKRDYGGDIWISDRYFETTGQNFLDPLAPQKALKRTILHEIAHALGLSHTHDDVRKKGKPDAFNKSQTWGDRTCCSIMSYGSPRYAALMKHDIDALQSLWGRKKPVTEQGLTIAVTSAENYLINQRGEQICSTSRGPKVYDDSNIEIVDCSTANTSLHIDDTGVYDRSDLFINARHPKVLFTDYAKPRIIIDGHKTDRIILSSQNKHNLLLCRSGDDRIHCGRGDETIIFGRYHGHVNIQHGQGFLKLVLPFSVNQLQFSRLDDNLLIYNHDPIKYYLPIQGHVVTQEKEFWWVKNNSGKIISKFSVKNYAFYQEDGKHVFKAVKPRLIKIINGFLHLGRIAIYDKNSLSTDHKNLLAELSKEAKYYRLQNFNPDTLSQPIYGHDVNNNTIVLQGYWCHLAFSAVSRDAAGNVVKTRKIPKIKIVDRHVSHLRAENPMDYKQSINQSNKRRFITTKTLVIKAHSVESRVPESILAFRELQENKNQKLEILDQHGRVLTVKQEEKRLPYRQ